MADGSWNPRYLAYARAQGQPDPDRMLALDAARWPGGRMAGYILWIGDRWAEFRSAFGWGPYCALSRDDHAAFDAWLLLAFP